MYVGLIITIPIKKSDCLFYNEYIGSKSCLRHCIQVSKRKPDLCSSSSRVSISTTEAEEHRTSFHVVGDGYLVSLGIY